MVPSILHGQFNAKPPDVVSTSITIYRQILGMKIKPTTISSKI